MDAPAHEVRLELTFDGDSPTGHAIVQGEEARRFTGWLGLVAAVEALVSADRGRSPDGESSLGSGQQRCDDG